MLFVDDSLIASAGQQYLEQPLHPYLNRSFIKFNSDQVLDFLDNTLQPLESNGLVRCNKVGGTTVGYSTKSHITKKYKTKSNVLEMEKRQK